MFRCGSLPSTNVEDILSSERGVTVIILALKCQGIIYELMFNKPPQVYRTFEPLSLPQLFLHLRHLSLPNAKQLIIIIQDHSAEHRRAAVYHRAPFMAIIFPTMSPSTSLCSLWLLPSPLGPVSRVLPFNSICLRTENALSWTTSVITM